MQNNQRYFRIGLLAVSSLLLLTGVLFYLGLADEFADRIHFVTTFSESVQGLTKGAAVKYKGVPIGTVDRLTIMTQEKLIRVDMSIDPDVFVGFKHISNDDMRMEQIMQFCRQSRSNGLCCRLDLAGITGMRYVEMDFVPREKHRVPPLPEIDEQGIIYFPSVPSTFNNIIDSVALSLDKIAQVDINKLSENIDKNLVSLHNILGDPSIQRTLEQLEKASENLEIISKNLSENITGDELKRFIDGVNDNLNNLNILTSQLHAKLDQIDAGHLSRQLGDALNESHRLLEDIRDSNSDASRTIQQISRLIDNLDELINILKQDPSSLLRGKKAEPVDLNR